MRWPYWSCLLMFLATFGYIAGLNYYQEEEARQSVQHWDRTTGTWKKDYDWQADNRRNAFLDRLRYVFLAWSSLHSVVNVFYAWFCRAKGRQHAIALVFFIVTTVILAFLWLAAAVPAGGMIG